MTDLKYRRELESLIEALNEVPDASDGDEAVKRLGLDVKSWAKSIRARAANAESELRKRRFAEASKVYEEDLVALSRRPAEPSQSKEELQRVLRALVQRAPTSAAASVHFHKFEEATTEELAEMVRTLRHLLGDYEE